MTTVAFVHAAPAALDPLSQHYRANAPELEVVNLLDDGLLRYFRSGDLAAAEERLAEMLLTARDRYAAQAALVTCSAADADMVQRLGQQARIPVLKIDDSLARAAASRNGRTAVLVTFAPTLGPTEALLRSAAGGRDVEFTMRLVAGAWEAAATGDLNAHHDAITEAALELARDHDRIVLAQVSMYPAASLIRRHTNRPVYSAVETSLAAIREALSLR